MAESTNALSKSYDKALANLKNHKTKQPKPTWSVQSNLGATESIDRLIKNSPVGSAQRQALVDQKAAYNNKLKEWQARQDTYIAAAEMAQKAYQASSKLEPLLKKQADNKDTNKTDAALNAKVEELKNAINAKKGPELRYGPMGESLAPGTDAYTSGSTTRPNAQSMQTAADATKAAADAKAAADKAAIDKSKAGKATADAKVTAQELALKTMYVDYLRSTFAGLDNKQQKAEIDGLFDKASSQGWTAENFQMALEGTSWWQTTLPSLRSWYLNTHDPRKQSTTVELIRNKVASVSSYLEQLGITVQGIDPVTGKAFDKTGYVSGIAQEAVKNGWDENQLRDYLAGQAPIVFTGGGEIGSSLSKIRDAAYAYGVKLDPTYEKMINNSLLDSSDGRDASYYIAEMRRQAIESPNNKPFTEALNSGRTLYEATRSYRNQMAGLLEVDESNVTWDDLMKKTVDSTTGAARTFADFTKQVKSDPLWQTTRNAKETYSTTALDLAKMFGLVG